MNDETVSNEVALNVAIGQKVAELLNLKFGKDGRTKTSWGTKSIQGLGASIARIVEEEEKRKQTNVLLDDNKWNYDRGLITTDEYNARIKEIGATS